MKCDADSAIPISSFPRSRANPSALRAGLGFFDFASLWLPFLQTIMAGTNLEGVSLFGSLSEGASFKGANLRNADLESGNYEDADFTNAVLEGAFVNNAQVGVEAGA